MLDKEFVSHIFLSTNLIALKMELPLNPMKKLMFKRWKTNFFKKSFTGTHGLVSLSYCFQHMDLENLILSTSLSSNLQIPLRKQRLRAITYYNVRTV